MTVSLFICLSLNANKFNFATETTRQLSSLSSFSLSLTNVCVVSLSPFTPFALKVYLTADSFLPLQQVIWCHLTSKRTSRSGLFIQVSLQVNILSIISSIIWVSFTFSRFLSLTLSPRIDFTTVLLPFFLSMTQVTLNGSGCFTRLLGGRNLHRERKE